MNKITQNELFFSFLDGILKPGECYFQPTFNGRPLMLNEKICLVAKSPSYHLGDIRILKLTSCEKLAHLYDVLVFPIQGYRPHSNEIVSLSIGE